MLYIIVRYWELRDLRDLEYLRALGCSVPSVARALLRARGSGGGGGGGIGSGPVQYNVCVCVCVCVCICEWGHVHTLYVCMCTCCVVCTVCERHLGLHTPRCIIMECWHDTNFAHHRASRIRDISNLFLIV